ncbi:hypothetical protein TNCV_3863461 [Trichonephila clavipes]|uniref:Uncharacterized protein n=1 Tax=Trichonephila clavipes TaxID=2585209 RepID=A0A8X6SB17_TRICX|nr:hypothetical protein TNCV_3863461 [Trichonephila clavipes]
MGIQEDIDFCVGFVDGRNAFLQECLGGAFVRMISFFAKMALIKEKANGFTNQNQPLMFSINFNVVIKANLLEQNDRPSVGVATVQHVSTIISTES